jgi:hypothetical protein
MKNVEKVEEPLISSLFKLNETLMKYLSGCQKMYGYFYHFYEKYIKYDVKCKMSNVKLFTY